MHTLFCFCLAFSRTTVIPVLQYRYKEFKEGENFSTTQNVFLLHRTSVPIMYVVLLNS
jgi:hypothetical protein